jgi:hypothetical protein
MITGDLSDSQSFLDMPVECKDQGGRIWLFKWRTSPKEHEHTHIREEKLLQLVLWKMVHFALFLVKISINFSTMF